MGITPEIYHIGLVPTAHRLRSPPFLVKNTRTGNTSHFFQSFNSAIKCNIDYEWHSKAECQGRGNDAVYDMCDKL